MHAHYAKLHITPSRPAKPILAMMVGAQRYCWVPAKLSPHEVISAGMEVGWIV